MARKSKEASEFEQSRKDILEMSGKDEEQRYAWEIELEEYRARKKLDRFLKFGAVCGIVSLIVSLGLVWSLYINV